MIGQAMPFDSEGCEPDNYFENEDNAKYVIHEDENCRGIQDACPIVEIDIESKVYCIRHDADMNQVHEGVASGYSLCGAL